MGKERRRAAGQWQSLRPGGRIARSMEVCGRYNQPITRNLPKQHSVDKGQSTGVAYHQGLVGEGGQEVQERPRYCGHMQAKVDDEARKEVRTVVGRHSFRAL